MTENVPKNRTRLARPYLAIAALSLAAIPAAAQNYIDDWAKRAGEQIVWHRTRLSDTVYLLLPEPALAGNLAVSAGEDGILIVDDETKIIPGHGPLATKADLQRYHDYVTETIDHIDKQKSAGKSLEDVQKDGLPEKFAPYGNGPLSPEPVWIGYVWASLDD